MLEAPAIPLTPPEDRSKADAPASQSISNMSDSRLHETSFSIGICATAHAPTLPKLLETIRKESLPPEARLERIIVVASECSEEAIRTLTAYGEEEGRLLLVKETTRKGKAAAINQILNRARGDFLVFVNSDALPERGAVAGLLRAIKAEERIGVVSAAPYFECRRGLVSGVLRLMWLLHNDWSLTLNHAGLNNHTSDELMVVDLTILQELPLGLVNDGAYIAGSAFQKGYSIKFSQEARVKIDVPRRLSHLIQQRRRIIFGHFQVWGLLGQAPRTAELMLFTTPEMSLSLLVRRVAKTPSLMVILPVALVSDAVAFMLAVKDTLTATTMHAVWKRYGD